MFAYLYQLCVVIFLLQGVSTPFVLAALGLLTWRQSRRLEALEKMLKRARRDEVKSGDAFERILAGLPKLKPLKCDECAGSVLLRADATLCTYCGTSGDLPEDYAAAVSLKSRLRRLLRSARAHWRVARILTHPVIRWVFILLIFAEPFVLFPAVVIGSSVYRDAWVDRAFGALGESVGFVVMLSAFLGFIVWMVVFILLSGLSKSLRKQLPAVPVFAPETRGRETARCQTCGGGIEYGAGDFACLCDYCNVVNLRVSFARRERAVAGGQLEQTKSLLFDAMRINDEYVGTAFFTLAILVGACLLLTLFYAIKN